AIFDCEAAALPGRFLPELGRSSERPFFLAGLLRPECVARSLMGIKPTSFPRSCSGRKIPSQNRALRNGWGRSLDAPAQRPKSLRQNLAHSVRSISLAAPDHAQNLRRKNRVVMKAWRTPALARRVAAERL